MRRTYLDHNATAPLRPEARAAMLAAFAAAGNPSSVHTEGRRARTLVEDAREQVAALINAKPAEVVFTSGATEANNWVLAGDWDTVIVSAMEHDSVLAPARRSTVVRVRFVPARCDGMIDPDNLRHMVGALGLQPQRALLSVHMANNETGVVQDIGVLTPITRGHGLALHTDAVQGLGKIAVDFKTLGADTMSLSGHKIGGPKGVGALVVREGADVPALICGGGQERRRRAGTENVIGIAGFGAAAAAAARDLEVFGRLGAMRDRLEREVKQMTPEVVIVGETAGRLANTSCLALPGAKAETLVIALDLAGIAVSAGAACSSGKVTRSHVLEAMGLGPELAAAAIRVSLGWNSSEADVDAFCTAWCAMTAAVPRRAVA